MINYPFFYIRCEHRDTTEVNFDLIVRAEDEADALVLWQDIAAEPFSNPGFLLDEAKRLLRIHATKPAPELE